jgi:acyl-CoA thioester hydrolase
VSKNLGKDITNLCDIEKFQHWTPVSLRFSDQDSLGHINNVSYAAYIEQARVAFINDIVCPNGDHINYILANLQIDYRQEMYFPGNVDVGACLLKIGSKSITTGYGLFKDEKNIASGSSVNVFFDSITRKTIPIPDNLRKSLEKELVSN